MIPIRRAALATFVAVLAVEVAALCPGPWWLDSSEFAAATFTLGVAHPPGHPVALLWGKLFALLPLGPIAFRVGLGQAVAGALGAACLALLGARLALRLVDGVGEAAAALLGAGGALLVSLGFALGFQAVRPEVYALNTALCLAAFAALERYDAGGDRRWLLLGALALGLGLANHHYLTLLAIAPVPLLLWRERARRRLAATVAACFAAGAVGLCAYLYLPLRAARHPLVDWGAPTTWSRFFWVVSAAPFRKSVRAPEAGDADVMGALVEALHPIGFLLAALGLYLLVRRRETRRIGLALGAAIALGAGGRALQGFDPANPDAYGYLSPAIALLAAAACAGAAFLVGRVGRPRARIAVATLLAFGGAAAGALSFPRIDRARFWDVDAVIGRTLAQAPPRAWLLSTHFQTVFALWYLQAVEGRRPDVAHVCTHQLPNPGYRDEALARFSDERGFADALGDSSPRLAGLLAAAPRRRALVEFDMDTAPDLAARLQPYSLLDEVVAAPARDPAVAEAARRRRAEAEEGTSDDPETRRNRLWRAFLGLNLACRTGDRARLEEERSRAARLLGDGASPEIEALLDGDCPIAATR